MSIFAGNLSSGILIKLPPRFLLVPLMQKASFLICFRAYGSSGPVRYITKKYSKRSGVQDSWSRSGSRGRESKNCLDFSSLGSKLSQGGNDTERMLTMDENYLNKLTSSDRNFDVETENDALEMPEEDVEELKIYKGKDTCEQDAAKSSKAKHDAEKLAIEALARRALSAVQLRKKLHGKKFHLEIIEELIRDFQKRGLINDYAFAETFSRSRWSSLSWGPRRIKQALLQKGVNKMDVEKAVKTVFEEDSDGDRESILGISKLSMDHLFDQASKQWLRSHSVPLETRKSRIIRWLQYRGFNWGITRFILKKLESQYPN